MDDLPDTPAIEPGALLVAGVELADGIFDETVVLVLDADAAGALGVILNRLSDIALESALPGWAEFASFPRRLHDGGPVSPEGAICLASPVTEGEEPPGWRRLFGRIGLLHLDTPLEIARDGYADLRIFAGYSGWAPGQLEREIALGAWHVLASRYSDAFDPDPTTLWRRTLRRQGGELGLLSTWTARPDLN